VYPSKAEAAALHPVNTEMCDHLLRSLNLLGESLIRSELGGYTQWVRSRAPTEKSEEAKGRSFVSEA